MNRRLFAAAALALLLPGMALAQVFVVPRRPDKSAINSFDFQWQHVDILVGPQAKGLAKPPDRIIHEQPPGAPGGPTANAPSTTPSGTSGPITEVTARRDSPTPPQTGLEPGTILPVVPTDGGTTAGLPPEGPPIAAGAPSALP